MTCADQVVPQCFYSLSTAFHGKQNKENISRNQINLVLKKY